MPHHDVTIERQGEIALIGFHRPPDNFFDAELIGGIADAAERVQEDSSSRVIVLWSEGKHFCAGAKISGGADDPTRSPLGLYEAGLRLFRVELPIIAAVQGAAVGGGLGLALAADFRVAATDVRFSCNFARLGFHQGFGITVTLPAVVGQQRALDLLYTGGQLRGEDALKAGICERLVAREGLVDAAVDFAGAIAGSGPLAVRAIRRTVRGDLADRVWAAMQRESEAQMALSTTEDFAEGVRAMAQRRAPVWAGR